MKDYLKHDEWNIIEEGFHVKHNRISESVFSLGNGRMGQRANFEEYYSGDSLKGNYVAGIYYPDKTRVGWWKNGYPEYFAKVLNAADWVGLHIELDGEMLDLAKCEVDDFYRVLNMKEGYLERRFEARLVSGKIVKVVAQRFCSIVDDEVGAIRYALTPVNFSGPITISALVDVDVVNEDSNYDEKFWEGIKTETEHDEAYVIAETKKTAFQVCTGMKLNILSDGEKIDYDCTHINRDKYAACVVDFKCEEGKELLIYKYAANLSSMNHPKESLLKNCKEVVQVAFEKGFETMKEEQAAAWAKKWEVSDVIIEGDVAAQQGIRFNIFQMHQTYTGEDERLNIGPKGFTGEKYGGSTYWDTEAYCLPFYLATADEQVSRNLLVYRYKHLDRAIENAEKLGFKNGAALYPMVTMNGEECHNEWEITFEEIHRNGAIAYAIFDYIRYTGDKKYLIEYGLEVLIGIARFWNQRVHFSSRRGKYVMHGVTGPNEYDNNVNNNWYTNYIAAWCIKYATHAIEYVRTEAPDRWKEIEEKIKFYEFTELGEWKKVSENMYLPFDKELGVFEQADGFFDKEWELTADDLKAEDRPIHQNWSWDRILRSVFIKQADVLQGLYFFEDHFDQETLAKNFDFYEPRTVHESSLSPCVHAIQAAKLGRIDKAYEMYLRTARLDLDDYNNDTEDGCHITSMAGTWMAVVKGFGGMRVMDDQLVFNTSLPKQWQGFAFKIRFRGNLLQVIVKENGTSINNLSPNLIKVLLNGKEIELEPMNETVSS